MDSGVPVSRHSLIRDSVRFVVPDECTWADLYGAQRWVEDNPVYRAVIRGTKGSDRLDELDRIRTAEDSWENEGGAPAYA